jgi:hypothetical protein
MTPLFFFACIGTLTSVWVIFGVVEYVATLAEIRKQERIGEDLDRRLAELNARRRFQ